MDVLKKKPKMMDNVIVVQFYLMSQVVRIINDF